MQAYLVFGRGETGDARYNFIAVSAAAMGRDVRVIPVGVAREHVVVPRVANQNFNKCSLVLFSLTEVSQISSSCAV